MSITNPSPPPVPPWPEQDITRHPFDDPYVPPDPDKTLASINSICQGWHARRFRSYFAATLRGPDYVLTVFADSVSALTGRIAEENARWLP